MAEREHSAGEERDRYLIAGSAAGSAGSALLATLASACCAGPALVALLGASGAVAAAGLVPYRPYFLGAAVLMLGLGFFQTYRPRRACADGSCRQRPGSRAARAVLWGAALVTLLSTLMGCHRGVVSPHQALSSRAEPLRARFNADAGKVRVLLLAAPS